MNNLDKQYTDLLQTILDFGVTKMDRTGTGTKSIFGYTIRHNMKHGFPLLTTKKMAWKTMVTELLWFLRGDTNIKYLVDNDCHIWDGDAYKNYFNKTKDLTKDDFEAKGNGVIVIKGFDLKSINQYGNISGTISNSYFIPYTKEEFINKIKTDDEFAKKWGELGPVYGKQWRDWNGKWKLTEEDNTNFDKWRQNLDRKGIDQIQNLINELKTNPDSRRLMVSAWNVGELDQMVLPPCHYGFQVYTRELSVVERMEYYGKHFMKETDSKTFDELCQIDYDKLNIPTRAISLMWNQRSVDTFLGLPFNIASYGLLLTMIADEVNMVPDELIGNLGDAHIYLNHIEQAKEQIGRKLTDEERYNIWFDNNYETGMERFFDPNKLPNFDDLYYKHTPYRTREPYPLPKVSVRDGIYCSSVNDVILENYQSHPAIKAPLSN